MPAIDFNTALGRLLQDGGLRDQLAADPEAVVARMELRDRDRAALLALSSAGLEDQAQVLLRKRLEVVRAVIPGTCRELGQRTWLLFSQYARTQWPTENPAVTDAHAFCSYLRSVRPGAVIAWEWNRLCFALSGKVLAVHWLRRHANQGKPALQILFRFGPHRWREVWLSAKL